MKHQPQIKEEIETLGDEIFCRFKKLPPKGKEKVLARIDAVQAEETDAEIISLFNRFKNLLIKESEVSK